MQRRVMATAVVCSSMAVATQGTSTSTSAWEQSSYTSSGQVS
ncbi:hypothetical protein [Nannocystis sp.]|nr:hypothetical protein [Nannocystis sp.]